MRMIRPQGEKLTHQQLVHRAETYRTLENTLYCGQGNEFADKLQRRFHRLAVQYEQRADAFMVVQPPFAPRIRL